MDKKLVNNPILRKLLDVYIIICFFYFVFIWGRSLMMGHTSLCQLLETFVNSILCIANVIGIVYISRNLRFGIYILIAIPLIILILLFLLQKEISGFLYVSLILSLVLFALLGLKYDNKIIWKQMDKGIDLVHFKHIYQLSVVLIIIITGYTLYNYKSVIKENACTSLNRDVLLNDVDRDALLNELDKIDITLDKISKIEKTIKDLPPQYEARIMALKHILSAHIVPNDHNIKAFKTTYFLRKGALSEEQKKVLDWFFRQNGDVLKIWETSVGNNSIESFQETLRKIMKQRKLTEL